MERSRFNGFYDYSIYSRKAHQRGPENLDREIERSILNEPRRGREHELIGGDRISRIALIFALQSVKLENDIYTTFNGSGWFQWHLSHRTCNVTLDEHISYVKSVFENCLSVKMAETKKRTRITMNL